MGGKKAVDDIKAISVMQKVKCNSYMLIPNPISGRVFNIRRRSAVWEKTKIAGYDFIGSIVHESGAQLRRQMAFDNPLTVGSYYGQFIYSAEVKQLLCRRIE